MHLQNEEKMEFKVETSNFCYKFVTFGLKNAYVTYQHHMDKVIQLMLGQNMKAYVDDMVVKSINVRKWRIWRNFSKLYSSIS